MALFLFANNASSVLASAISSTATVIDLSPGTGALFPNPAAGQQFTLTLNDAATGLVYEIVYCTARSTDTLTVVRGQEGTAAVSWLANDRAFLAATAGALGSLAPLASPAFTGTPTVPTAVGGTNTTQAASTAFVAANFAAIAGNSAQQFSVAPGTVDTQAAALAQVFGWKAGTLSGNHTIAAADAGIIYAVTATSAVITLPAASTLTNQTGGVIAEAACTVTLASGTLEGGSLQGSTSVALAVGDFLYWQAGASNWRVLAASPHLISLHGVFYSTTSGSWTVPAGVFGVLVEAWGGGGGGSGNASNQIGPCGGGGAYGAAWASVTPGQVIDFTIGAGGAGGAYGGNAGGNGGATSVTGALTMTVDGGSGGQPNTGAGASGGPAPTSGVDVGVAGGDATGSAFVDTVPMGIGGMGGMGAPGRASAIFTPALGLAPGGGGGAGASTTAAVTGGGGGSGAIRIRW